MTTLTLREPRLPYGLSPAHTNNQQRTTSNRPALTEADLSTLWAGQRFPAAALVTRAGAPVRVLHPGRAGRGAGPDFRDAIIGVPSAAVLRGDVELHVRASDFRIHGHEGDHRYDRLVLHVVFEDDADQETLLACGRRVAVVALAPWVRRRADELNSWLSAPRLWREPCHDATARVGAGAVLGLLDELGAQRFRARISLIAEQVERLGPGEALFRTLLEGLGYGGNQTRIAQTAERVDWRKVTTLLQDGRARTLDVEALLLTAAGGLLVGHSGRPANHPERRIKGLAALLVRHRALFLEAPAVNVLLALSARDLAGTFTVGSLIGRSRALELLTNAVLPWVAACARKRERPDMAELALARYAELPRAGHYGALGFLETNLRNGDRPLSVTAQRQQGLLALYKSECTQGGCGRCALS